VETPVAPEFELPAPGARQIWPPRAQWAAGCGSGCALLVLLEGLAIWAIAYAMIYSPQQLAGSIRTPKRVSQGMPFPLTVVVKNESKRPATLTAIVARSTLTDQLTLTAPQPAPPGAPTTMLGTTTWQYQKEMKPGQRFTVTFQAIPNRSGTLRGSLELQAGFVPYPVSFSVEVDPAEESGSGAQ